MLLFKTGINDEKTYQDWFGAHGEGFVVSLNPSRQGSFTLHTARCKTIQFHRDDGSSPDRSGMLCFETWQELNEYALTEGFLISELNRCSRCKVDNYIPQTVVIDTKDDVDTP